MKKILMALAITLFAVPAQANYDEKVSELIQIMNLNEQEALMNAQIVTPLICSFDIPTADESDVANRVSKVLNFKNKMIEIVTPIWKNNFTEEELDEILNFYKTEVGKKTIALMPKMSQYIAEEVGAYQNEITPQLNTIITDLVAKYGRRSSAEAERCARSRLQ